MAVDDFEACKRRTLAGQRSVFDRELRNATAAPGEKYRYLPPLSSSPANIATPLSRDRIRMVSTLKM
jgi:hypothetical protein